MLESDLEDLLHESPWILSPDFDRVRYIEGDLGILGRQVRLSSAGRRIDLLFRDARTGRPVVVELKRGALQREDVGQVLEYGGAFRFLPNDDRPPFEREFGLQLGFPRLILVGESVDEITRAAAGLAGVEIRTFSTPVVDMDPSVWRRGMEEYQALAKQGEYPGLAGRHELADRVWYVLDQAATAVLGEGLGTANQSYRRLLWWYATHPLCDFTVRRDGEPILGVFEFSPFPEHELHFNPETFWVSYSFNALSDEAHAAVKARLSGPGMPAPEKWIGGNPVYGESKGLFDAERGGELRGVFEGHLRRVVV